MRVYRLLSYAYVFVLLSQLAGCQDIQVKPESNKELSRKTPDGDAYVLRGGKKVKLKGFMNTQAWLEQMKDGDTVYLSEGKFYLSKIAFAKKSIVFQGAGKNKTLVTIMNPSVTNGHGVTFTNMTVDTLKGEVFDPKSYFHFFDVRIKSYSPYIRKSFEGHPNVPKMVCVFCQFDKLEKGFGSGWALHGNELILYSATGREGSLKPYFPHKNQLWELGKYAERWEKEFDASNLTSLNNFKIYSHDFPLLKHELDQLSFSTPLALKQVDSITTARMNLPIDYDYHKQPEAVTWVNSANKFKTKNLQFLTAFSLYQARQSLGGFPSKSLNAMINKNEQYIDANYGCNVSLSVDHARTASSQEPDRSYMVVEVNKKLESTIPIMAKRASGFSKCHIQLDGVLDYFKIAKNGKTTVLTEEQLWKESEASKKRRQQYEMQLRAARQARADAARKRFNQALSNLSSTAKQLYQNRNYIEGRADGTYLVVNNKPLKTHSVPDLPPANFPTMSSGNITYEKNGTRTTYRFYQTLRDVVQYNLNLSYADKSVTFKLPVDFNQRNVGPCVGEHRSGWSDIYGDTVISGPCGRGVYPDNALRSSYARHFVNGYVEDFIYNDVAPKMIANIQRSSSGKDDASTLERLIGASLLGGKVDEKKVSSLSQKVFGKTYSVEEIQKEIISKGTKI